jgi:glycosyltransferase involved in cell wall biosynthesis
LPVLEAMARGVPVATSGRASLAEVAGDAALLFDPEDVDSIRAAIERLLSDDQERARLAAAGRERAEAFTWERTAELTAEVYGRALA